MSFINCVIFAEMQNAMDKIIVRESELGLLDKYNKSGKSDFVALYGRRRDGKSPSTSTQNRRFRKVENKL